MPTYQYRCAKCGEQFEVWQSIHDDSFTVHDGECGGALSKVMGVSGIVLKGSGFYRNDSRAKPPREGKEGAKPKETAGTNGSGDKSDKDKGDKKEQKKDDKKSDAATSPSKSESSKT